MEESNTKELILISTGWQEIHFVVVTLVIVKELGLFIAGHDTESRGGHDGAIPERQSPEINIKNDTIGVICAKGRLDMLKDPLL